jgi:phosphoglucomutase
MRLGPDGWRGLLAEGVTIDRVRRLASAWGGLLATAPGRGRKGVVVAHDSRFLGPRFAGAVAEAWLAHGIPVVLLSGPVPAPTVSCAVAAGRRSGALYVTGGDAPAETSGVSLYDGAGAPAPEELLHRVDAAARVAQPVARRKPRAAARRVDPSAAYLNRLQRMVPAARVRRVRLRVAADGRHGAAARFLPAALRSRAAVIATLHEEPRPDFGGLAPTCADLDLKAVGRAVRLGRTRMGLAINADGTRCGVVDERGAPVPPGPLAALVADFLLSDGRAGGGVARSVAATHLLDDVAAAHGRPLVEVPFGAASLAAALGPGGAFLGVDESGGLALASHARVADGILLALFATEIAARDKRPVREAILELQRRLGPRVGRRIDYHVDPNARDRAVARLREVPSRFAGRKVSAVAADDARKWILADGSWVLFRAEAEGGPLRCHLEARSVKDLEAMTAAARDWVTRPGSGS